MQESSVIGEIFWISGRYWDDIDPNDNSGMKKILSSCDIYQVSIIAWFYNSGTGQVRSFHLYTSPILVLVTDILYDGDKPVTNVNSSHCRIRKCQDNNMH